MTPSFHMGGYVRENGAALARTLESTRAGIAEIAADARARGCRRIVVSGVGGSYAAAWAAKAVFDEFVAEPTYVIPSTELERSGALLDEETLAVVLSRSGERQRVVEGLRAAEDAGAFTVAVTGSPQSLMAQMASRSLVTAEGPEISFPKTKSVTTGAGLLTSLALELAADRAGAAEVRRALDQLPALIDQIVAACVPQVESLVSRLDQYDRVVVAGTSGNAGAAMAAALLMQEGALLTTQWSDTGNLFHGALCPLDQRWLVIVAATAADAALTQDTFQLVTALGAGTLGLLPRGVRTEPQPTFALELPDGIEGALAPLVYLPVLQLLAYHWAVERGLDPDAPRGSDVMLQALLPPGREEPEAGLSVVADAQHTK